MTPRASSALCVLLALAAALSACNRRAQPQDAPDATPATAAEPATEEAPEPPSEPSETSESEPPSSPERPDEAFLAGSVDDVQLLRLYADAFAELPARQRLQAYHLARAVLAARDIAFDQVHKDGVEARRFFESLLSNGLPTEPDLEIRLWNYLKLLWIHGGFFDRLSGRKLATGFQAEEVKRAAALASATGMELDLNKGEPLEEKLSRLTEILFAPSRLVGEVSPLPATPDEPILELANLYAGVMPRDVAGFSELHARNSRLIRIDGQPFEEVFRAGDRRRKIPPGRYAVELSRVIQRLQDAQIVSPRPQREQLAALIEYFRSGDAEAFEQAGRLWAELDLPVDAALGFLNLGLDPRRRKGVFCGMVGVRDAPATSLLQSLLAQWDLFWAFLPEGVHPKQPSEAPRATALHLIAFSGRHDATCPTAFPLSGDMGAQDPFPRKAILFSNVIESRRRAFDLPLTRLLLPADAQAGVAEALGNGAFILRALREIPGRFLGHPGGGSQGILRGLDETLQAARAELVALWLLHHPRLVELHWLQPNEPRLLEWFWTASALAHQALWRGELQDPDALGERLVLRYLVEKSKAAKLDKQDGKVFLVIPDPEAFHREVGSLLARIDRIRAEGRRTQALRLLERYGAAPHWPELDAVEKQLRGGGLRRMAACLQPRLTAVKDDSGKTQDASISYSESLEQQILRLRRY